MQDGDSPRPVAPASAGSPGLRSAAFPRIETLLLAATRVCTFLQQRLPHHAKWFFFERDGRLFLVTSRT